LTYWTDQASAIRAWKGVPVRIVDKNTSPVAWAYANSIINP